MKGCSVPVTRTVVVAENNADLFELKSDEVDVIWTVEEPQTYPVPATQHTFEYLCRSFICGRARTP